MNINIRSLYGLFTFITFITFANNSFALTYTMRESNEHPCITEGYNLTRCPIGKKPAELCPTDTLFFKSCECDSYIYPYSQENCPSPKVLTGDNCDNKLYKKCECSEEYNKNCYAPMVGDEQECDNKYKSCKCPDQYKNCPFGGKNPTPECTEENGTTKYMECKITDCEEDGYLSKIPAGQYCKAIMVDYVTCYDECKPMEAPTEQAQVKEEDKTEQYPEVEETHSDAQQKKHEGAPLYY